MSEFGSGLLYPIGLFLKHELAVTYRLPMGKQPDDFEERAVEAIALCEDILLQADGLIGVDAEKGDWK